MSCEKNENKKRPGLAHFTKIFQNVLESFDETILLNFAFFKVFES